MASTNKTTNYELSQYIGSDKPTYLGDYNSDMQKIDTQMKANNDLATSANSTATTANEKAGTALSNANTAQSTAETANTTATSALGKATQNEANINKFNLTNHKKYLASGLSIDAGTINPASYINVSTNSDGTIAKIYGALIYTHTGTGGATITLNGTDLRPTEAITINGNIITQVSTDMSIYENSISISPNGDISFKLSALNNVLCKAIVINSLLLMTNFGDAPATP